METLVMTAQFLTAIIIMILLHELGHFIAARRFGIRVEKFFIFFDAWGKKLFSFRRGDTEYGFGWLPLGGYVKISGMVDESLDVKKLAAPPQPWEFRSKPAWQRLIVMLAGVTVNVLLALFIFGAMKYVNGDRVLPIKELRHGIVALEMGKEAGLQTGDKILAVNGNRVHNYSDIIDPAHFMEKTLTFRVERGGETVDVTAPEDFLEKISSARAKFIEPRMTFSVGEVVPGSRASKAGLQPGDSITAINGSAVGFFDECRTLLEQSKGNKVQLTLMRGGEEKILSADVDENGKLGFYPTDNFEYETIRFGLARSFLLGAGEAIGWLELNIRGFGKIIRGELSFSSSVAGPIGIAAAYGGVWDWNRFWFLTGVLSMILAFVNLLPIPALDGGHAFFLLVEATTGIRFSDRFMEVAQQAGMLFLFILMVMVVGNDIWKLLN